MGLKIAEGFLDAVAITDAAGALQTGLAPACTVYRLDTGASTVLTVAEIGATGLYKVTDWTPAAATEYMTVWSVAGANIINYPFKLFKVGAGQEADIKTVVDAIKAKTDNLPADPGDQSAIVAEIDASEAKIDIIDGLHDVPAKDAVTNAHIRDVLGNKTDTPKWLFSDTQSVMSLLKAATHTGGGISYAGQCDAGMVASTTTIICAQLAGFGDDFFNTDYVLKVALNDNSHGASPEADAARDITDYDTATGTFTTAAFNNNVEANDKIVVSKRSFYLIDQIALQTTPGTNSLAYRLSQYLASGDGDWATGTPLPANISLYDILAGANGLDAWPAATAPANGISMAEVLHLVADRTEHHLVTRTFFSNVDDEILLPTDSSDVDLPDVVLPNITGTIVAVYAGIKFRMIENTNAGGTNAINVAQDIKIKKAAGAWGVDDIAAINLADNQWLVAASTREGGDCQIGDNDLVGEVDAFNATYNLRFENADVDFANLKLSDVQAFLIVSYY